MPEVELDVAALCAERIMETVSPSTVVSTSPGLDYMKLLQIIRDLPRQLAKFAAERNRPNSKDLRSRSGNRLYISSRSSTALLVPLPLLGHQLWCNVDTDTRKGNYTNNS
jgi:hypothetical protein